MEHFLKGAKPSTSSAQQKVKSQEGKTAVAKVLPWVEKYRPKTVDEVVQQEEVVAVLKKVLQGFDLPNLLFYGPPGTGKTSAILAMARQLFGDTFRNRILELNASDERGIQVVRQKVKNFAQLTVAGTRTDGKPCPPIKIIILDEADSMTASAQAALRRIMEKESKTTRFCLICNYISRIIEPLTSRCSKFRFKQLDQDTMIAHLKKICDKEEVPCHPEALSMLITTSDGDLRKAITTLQSVCRLKGKTQEFTVEDVCEIASVVPTKWLDDLFEVCSTSYSYEKLEAFVQSFMAEGYAAYQIFMQLHDRIIHSDALSEGGKAALCECLAIRDHHLLEGADEYLQLMVVCTTLMEQLHKQ